MSVERLDLIDREAREAGRRSSVAEVDEGGPDPGKKSDLGKVKRSLGGLAADERKEIGRRLNDVSSALDEAFAARRAGLDGDERGRRLGLERLDLTETRRTRGPGHLHLVTQTIERLEDVFVGHGVRGRRGSRGETDWYNFEALQHPPHHPPGMWDTLYVEVGEAEHPAPTHTSPVQIRWMQEHRRR